MADNTLVVADKPATVSAGRVSQRSGPLREPSALTPDESARLAELKAKRQNPSVLPADVRTEDEEHEFRDLNKRDADARRAAAALAARPEGRPNPRERMAELKGAGALGEGATIELRRLEELVDAEDRVAALKKQATRTAEEEDELAAKQRFVADARAAGGFDPNG